MEVINLLQTIERVMGLMSHYSRIIPTKDLASFVKLYGGHKSTFITEIKERFYRSNR